MSSLPITKFSGEVTNARVPKPYQLQHRHGRQPRREWRHLSVLGAGRRGRLRHGMFGGTSAFSKDTDRGLLLRKNSDGRWTGFLDGVQDGDRYKFYVVGKGANG